MKLYFGRFLVWVLIAIILGWLLGLFAGTHVGLLTGIGVMAFPLARGYFFLEKIQKLSLSNSNQFSSQPSGAWGDAFSKIDRIMKDAHAQINLLETRHNRFIQGFQASPNGVVMLDDELHIEWCNASAENFFGINFRKDSLQDIRYLVRNPDFVSYLSLRRFELPIVIPKMGFAHELSISVQVFPFGDDQLLLIAQDVTDLQKTEAMRRDFVANVSHEIRTPLTVLIGFLETMQSIELSAEQRNRYLGLMMKQSSRMKSLVEDLLTLANLEANTSFAPMQEFDVVAEMASLKIDAEALSAGRHQIVFEVLTDTAVYGERRELHSAFSNLISNAIRYTPEGGQITVSWSLSPSHHGIFSVTDTGPGIDPVHLPRITERFYRVDGSRSRDTGGTGLGLAIVKHIATRHNAQLLITSVLGEGSTFKLRFAPERLV
ncbi:phosphate regulon sensor histidine kinase PhoR [Zwartia vadi]|uniref:phosphate regulon sensor histidine kinase PhoR n=1 Tax=Zwartia vadi TaxID=3058168 RepID=UPI0025B4A6F2|nr:phosphate regulon sensor histidine kinase PhoR [Zwartia vadi]MDN3988548.1 phosphate regulon sensor histidine kinase PhoR [Zwartia vadi]